MLFYSYFRNYLEKFSLVSDISSLGYMYIVQLLFLENYGHFGRHLVFLTKPQGNFQGLSVCYSTHIPVDRPTLKISACYQKCLPFITFRYNAQWSLIY